MPLSRYQEKKKTALMEFRHLVHLGLPLLATQVAGMGMGITDVIMAGHISAVDLAGVSLAGAVVWPCAMLMMGILQALTPSVAQLNGAGRLQEAGELVRQTLWMALIGSLILFWIMHHSGPYYRLVGVETQTLDVTLPYLEFIAWGMPALMGYFSLRFLAEGMGFTRPAMIIAITALILKIPINYVLMYGKLGLPALGGAGCGVSSAIVMWMEMLAMVYLVSHTRFRKTGWRSRFTWPDWSIWKKQLAIGLPIGTTIFLEMGVFTLVTILLGRFGAETVASHSIAMNLGGLTFMFPLALGMAATIRIGFNIGANEFRTARITAAVTLAGSLVTAVSAVFIFIFFREQLVALFTTDAGVRQLAIRLMVLVAFFQLFDHLQAASIGALRGYKDTRVPLWVTIGCYWMIGLPVGCVLGFGWGTDMTGVEALGIYGFWIGLIAGLGLVALLIVPRLWWLSGNHQAIERLSGIRADIPRS